MKPTHTILGQNSELLMLKQVVHTETTLHKELRNFKIERTWLTNPSMAFTQYINECISGWCFEKLFKPKSHINATYVWKVPRLHGLQSNQFCLRGNKLDYSPTAARCNGSRLCYARRFRGQFDRATGRAQTEHQVFMKHGESATETYNLIQ